MKALFCFLFIFIFSVPVFSQKKLLPDDLHRLQKQAEEYVYNFEEYVKNIPRAQHKEWYIIPALNLFEPKATIQVSNLNGNKKQYLLSSYLNNVVAKYSERYSVVVIEFLATKIGDLHEQKDKNGEIYYEGTFKFTQFFRAQKISNSTNDVEKRSFVADYTDVTTKKGKVIVKQVTTINGEQWVLKLSDISVEETNDADTNTH